MTRDSRDSEYRLLPWDSEFLGFRVARIVPTVLEIGELQSIVGGLRRAGVTLAYWASGGEAETVTEVEASRLGGRIVDQKTTFVARLDALDLAPERAPTVIEPYGSRELCPELRSLAIQAGEYSRFAVDPKIPRERFEALYERWIERSVSGELAEEVLVVRQRQRVVALITLEGRKCRGDIGLIAVDRQSRGKGFGESLVTAAQRWFLAHGFTRSQVVTQGTNAAACGLYRKCHYALAKVEPFFHFWLEEAEEATASG